MAYSVRPFEKPILVWDSLLAGVCSLIFHYYITTKLITLSFFFFPPQFQRQKETFFTSAVKVKVKGLQHLPECFVAHCATVIAKASMISISISQVKIIHRKYAHPLPSPSLSIDCLTIWATTCLTLSTRCQTGAQNAFAYLIIFSPAKAI